MHVYCLFCQTQRCKLIALLLERLGTGRVFSPQILQRERRKGKNEEVMRDLLPGYIFIYTEEPLQTERPIQPIHGIIRRIGNVETGYELNGEDRDFAMHLYEQNGTIHAVQVIEEGDRVILAAPLFMSCRGKITKVDRRKQRARVDFEFENTPCHTWIAFEFIQKEEQKN